MVDYYTFVSGTTPAHVRSSLTHLKQYFGVARELTQAAGIPLWACLQAHSWPGQRDVTPEEIRVQANLALAHGARGIYYFMVSSYINPTRNDPRTGQRIGIPFLHHSGLLDGNYTDTTNKWREVTALNARLEALAPTYLALTSNHVFAGSAPTDFVHSLSTTADYFLGTFTHTDGSRYLMVVNEDCRPTPATRTVTVALDAADLEEEDAYDYALTDVYGSRRLSPGGSDAQPEFSVTLDPGGGTLYRVEPILPALASFGSSSYEMIEGGEAVTGSGAGIRAEDPTQAARSVEVTVRLSSAPSERLEVPMVVTALSAEDTDEERDYGVRDLSPSGGLVFTGGSASASFEIRARGDDDVEDETIVLSFGLLPAGVRAGAPSASTVTIHDTPNQPEGLTAAPGHGEVTLRWDAPDPENRGIRGWQYQERVTGGVFGEWKPMGLGGLTDQTVFKLTEHTVGNLPNGVKHHFRIRAYTRGYGVASAKASATPNLLVAEAYRGAVLLRWTDPDRTDIASWQYRWRELPDRDRGIPGTSWSDWQTAGSGPSVRSQTVSGLRNGVGHRFKVQVVTSGGETAEIGSVVEATPLASLPLPANEAPSKPEGEPAVSMDEGQTDTAADYTSTDPEGTAIQWSLTGADAGSLAISAQGRLTFQNPPDYEAPGDQDEDRVYQVNVVASDGALSSLPLPVAVTVDNVNEAPSQPSGPAAVSMEEGLTDTEADYTSTDPEGTAIQWSLTGADAGSLAISAQGRLTFQNPPDYEAPGDQDEDRVYQVNVVASDGALSSLPLPVAVTVDNGPDPGVVTFSPDPPSVGQPVTASVADPDGGVTRHRNWNWSRVDAPRGARAPLSTTEEYTPTSQDVDYRLRVTVTYDDAQAPDQSATGTSEPVPPRPCELSLSGSKSSPVDYAENGTGAVATYTVTRSSGCDPAATLTWSRAGTNPSDFQFQGSGSSRSLHFNTPPNHEAQSSYQVTVEVTDGSASASRPVTVTVEDVNEAPSQPSGPAAVSMEEGLTDTEADYTSTDPEGTAIQWSLTGDDAEALQISDQGRITFVDAPDYEAPGDQDEDRVYQVNVVASDGALSSPPLPVAVTVDNVDEPGEVAFTVQGPPEEPLVGPPRVGPRLQAALSDPDGGVMVQGWQWQRQPAGGGFDDVPDSTSAAYRVTSADVCQRLRVRVNYRDGHGTGKMAVAPEQPEPVIDRPGAPANLSPTPGDRMVTLHWDEAPDHCSSITHYESRYYPLDPLATSKQWSPWTEAPADEDRTPPETPAEVRTRTVTGLVNGTEYTFEVRAENAVGDGVAASVPSTPRVCEATVAGPESVLVREEAPADSVIAAFTVSDCDGSTVTASRWEISGADHQTRRDTLQINASGQVSFKHRGPDYENPTDQDRDHDHEVQVRAQVGGRWSSPQSLVVVVENIDDPGTVTLTPSPPRVGRPVMAQLVDEDGTTENTDKTWSWSRATVARHHTPSVILSRSPEHTPTSADAGHRLEVTVGYDDAHGPDKTATGQSELPVRGVAPGPPKELSAAPGDRQVRLTWSAADDSGSAIDRYEYWSGSGDTTEVAGGGAARATTVTDLRNGTEYTFHVRAHNAEGDGPAASVTATPMPSRTVSYSASSYVAREETDTATVTVRLLPAATAAVEVPVTVRPGPNTETADFAALDLSPDSTVSFAAGASSASFRIAPRSDADTEDESVLLGFKELPAGIGPGAHPTATVSLLDATLKVIGPAQVSVEENGVTVAGYRATDAQDVPVAPVRWSRSGPDASRFRMTDSDTLEFVSESKPNYEHPLDVGGTNVYNVNLVAEYGEVYHSAPFPVVVTVTDANDPGSITITPDSPRVGEPLTATLTDEDGVISNTVAPFLWRAVEPGARGRQARQYETETYVAWAGAVGQHIEAFTTYSDRHGGGQRARGRTAEVVRPNVPGAPGDLGATPGIGRVALRWTAADSNGAWITAYEYQRSTDGGRTWWRPGWTGTGSGAGTTTYTETGLSSDTTYTFEVRAVNRVGAGPASNRASARPNPPPPCVLTLTASRASPVPFAENGTGAVATYTVTRSSSCNPTRQLTWSRTGTNPSDFQLQGSGSSRSLHFNTPPNHEAKSTYRVTVQVTDGTASASRTVTVNVTDVNEPPVISGPASPSVPENTTPVATYTATDPEDHTVRWRMASGGGTFSIGPDTGVLSFKSAKDYEALSSYTFTGTIRATDSGSASSTQAVTVTVTNVEEPGQLRLSTTQPRVGTAVTVRSLTDPDGIVAGTRTWKWQRGSSPTAIGTANRYTPGSADIGHTLRLTASYTDGHGPGKSATATTGEVPRPPCALSLEGPTSVDYPENSTGAVATYTATASHCGDLDWSPVGIEDAYVQLRGSGSSRSLHFHSPPNYETMRSYEVTVTVRSGATSASRTVTVNVQDVNEPPVISGPASPSVPENTTPVATYTATDPEDHTVRWTMASGGGTFSIGPDTGVLSFKSAKNYEALSSYTFTGTIRATDSGSASSTQAVTATVTNVDEPGTVTLSSGSPYVGDQLTATLTDPDQGIRQPTWSWTSGGTAARSSSVQSLRYTVPVGDFGKILKASVGYTDNHGPGKSASRTSSALVGAHRPDPPPDFDAARGDGQVVLTWGPADGNGAPITGYGYRYRSDTGSWPSRFTSISGRTVTISLTNGTLYHFQVQARSIGGASASSEASATPAGPPGAPQNLATDRQGGNGFMELSWEAASSNGSPILHYYYRYKKGSGDWRGWFRRAGGADARSKSWTNFDDGSSYVFQVRARNDVDYGSTAQISASALGPGGSRGARGEHEETEDELMPEGEVPEPGEDDVVVFAKPVADGPEASWLAGADSLAVRPGPNPFNPSTTLHFQLPEAGPVTLTVYNVAGQVVAELARGEVLEAGLHAREWFGTDEADRPVASGLYLYRLVAGDRVRVGKLALIR